MAELQAARLRRLERRVEALAEDVGELSARSRRRQPADEGTARHGPPRDQVDYSKSAEERALVAAGLAPEEAQRLKQRRDRLAMSEVYLRDQATREGWLDTPRFREEMAELAAQRTSVRDEIGDDSYDHYLYAIGRPNRLRVDDVMFESVAEEVGLKTGDLILSYDGQRLFAAEDLVEQTHEGETGETVVLDVVRNRERIEIAVPRGPLGVRVGATQDMPLAR